VKRVATWFRRCAWSVLLVMGLGLPGCRVLGNDAVRVKVIFAAPAENRELTDVDIVVGSDKHHWDSLRAGTETSVNLLPGPENDRQLTFLYSLNGAKRSWDGPKIPTGAGYRIEITIDRNGNISSRHCILPCKGNWVIG